MAVARSNCQGKGMDAKDKAARLAAALRENLKRRKTQARVLRDAGSTGSPAPQDEREK
jgi:hypothetical protein